MIFMFDSSQNNKKRMSKLNQKVKGIQSSYLDGYLEVFFLHVDSTKSYDALESRIVSELSLWTFSTRAFAEPETKSFVYQTEPHCTLRTNPFRSIRDAKIKSSFFFQSRHGFPGNQLESIYSREEGDGFFGEENALGVYDRMT